MKALRVAVHVRRGELFVVESHRMLPNAYYVTAAQNVQKALNALRIPHFFEIYTEKQTKPTLVYGKMVQPQNVHLEDWDVLNPRKVPPFYSSLLFFFLFLLDGCQW